ncbi:MAG: hypothetical protein KDI31_15510, partial [Pseudomonadales bacterium]|nr:hypothetical protein [Pseudomonadales bacterium]
MNKRPATSDALMTEEDEPPSPRPATNPLLISVRNATIHTGPHVHRDIPAGFDRSRVRGRTPKESRRVKLFRRAHYPTVTDSEWNDWRWQSRHRVRNLAQLEGLIELSADERKALSEAGSMLPLGITPYYMSLMDPVDAGEALRRTVIPTTREFLRLPGEADDPLGEDGHSPVPGLVHRYPDRV